MNYWEIHGLFFLFGLAVFPRITLLFSNAISLGILFWIGWFFVPHLTVALLATIFYFDTNPFLVLLSWFIALGGESAEKKYSYKIKKNNFNSSKNIDYEIINE